MLDATLLADLQLNDLPGTAPEAARLVEGSYLRLAGWLEGHLPRIGTLIAATSISLYGRYLTDTVRKTARDWPFLLRVGLFVVVVGFAVGAIIAAVAPLITAGLRSVGTLYLLPAILCAFIVIGILAERSGRI
ncbi:DUF3392 family protein [Vulgatibacter sp.]|uniref:DUF3392 family protein n=1 Tax=Vulgatibacter sp. TaxID=1971226 RepID=UPI003562ACCA